MAGVVIGITALAWNISADREVRTKFPEEGRFFPSRWWVGRYEYVYRTDLYEQVEQADYRARASQEARIGDCSTHALLALVSNDVQALCVYIGPDKRGKLYTHCELDRLLLISAAYFLRVRLSSPCITTNSKAIDRLC